MDILYSYPGANFTAPAYCNVPLFLPDTMTRSPTWNSDDICTSEWASIARAVTNDSLLTRRSDERVEVTDFFPLTLAPLPVLEAVGGVVLESLVIRFKWTKRPWKEKKIIHQSIHQYIHLSINLSKHLLIHITVHKIYYTSILCPMHPSYLV